MFLNICFAGKTYLKSFLLLLMPAVLILAVLAWNSQAQAEGDELWAGSAAVEVTPTAEMMDPEQKGPIYLGGYGEAREACPDQVWDDLWARTLLVESGGKSVAMTGVDSVGLLYDDCLEIKEMAREQLAEEGIHIDHIIISSSHTHHAPDTMGLWGPMPSMEDAGEILSLLGGLIYSEMGGPPPLESGINPHYQEFIRRQTAQSVVEAARDKRAVGDIRFGKQETTGLIRDTREPEVMDENIYVMHVEDTAGETISTLVKWASHPETVLGFYDEAITSDYVHFLRETVEEELGGTAVFINGAIGGLLTSLRVEVGYGTDKEASIPTMEHIGKEAGKAALQAVEHSEPGEVENIETVRRKLYLPLQNPNFYVAALGGFLERGVFVEGNPARREPFPPELGGTEVEVLTEVMAVNMGKGQFLTVPGEIYPEVAIGGYHPPEKAHNPDKPTEPVLTEHMSGEYNFIVGLANDQLGYIIPANDFVPLEQEGIFWESGEHRVSGEELYGETNSLGPSTAPILAEKSVWLLERLQRRTEKIVEEFTAVNEEPVRITGEDFKDLLEIWDQGALLSLKFEGGELLLPRETVEETVEASDSLEFSAQKADPGHIKLPAGYNLLEGPWEISLQADDEIIENLDPAAELSLQFDPSEKTNLQETALYEFDAAEEEWEQLAKKPAESFTAASSIDSLSHFAVLEKETSPPIIVSPLLLIFFGAIILILALVAVILIIWRRRKKRHLKIKM